MQIKENGYFSIAKALEKHLKDYYKVLSMYVCKYFIVGKENVNPVENITTIISVRKLS